MALATLATWPAISRSMSASLRRPSHRPSILLRATMRRAGGASIDVFAPDRQIALGDAGVGGGDEQHRVGVGQQVEGEFGFAPMALRPGVSGSPGPVRAADVETG